MTIPGDAYFIRRLEERASTDPEARRKLAEYRRILAAKSRGADLGSGAAKAPTK